MLGLSSPGVSAAARALGVEVVEPAYEGYEQAVLSVASRVEVVVIRSPYELRTKLISACPRLATIIRAGTGVDNIDMDSVRERGIEVVTTPVSAPAVAELAIGLALSVIRQIPAMNSGIRCGAWLKWQAKGSELGGKTIGIVGMGDVGQRTAKLAGAFGMTVLGYNGPRPPRVIPGVRHEAMPVSLRDLLMRSNLLMISCRLTPSTNRMIGASELALLPRGAVVVNVARGDVLVSDALVRSLNEGHLAGAGLDTVFGEPDIPDDLRKHPQIVVTPHIGAQTRETQDRISKAVKEHLLHRLPT